MMREGIKAIAKTKEWNSFLCLLVCTKELWVMKTYLNTAMVAFRNLLIVFKNKIINIERQPWGMFKIGIMFSL